MSQTHPDESHTTQVEIERKYAVDTEHLPDLVGVGDAVGVHIVAAEAHEPFVLEAVYFDTADLALARAKIALRRRVGGHDEGWHVKLPAVEGRTELQWPLEADPGQDAGSADGVPAAVRAAVLVHVRDRALSPLAAVRTSRSIVELLDADGRVVVEIADDTVTGTDSREGSVRLWREWEAELGPGAPATADGRAAVLDAVEKRLFAAGATVSPSVSKLAQALGRTGLGRTPDAARGAGEGASTDAGAEVSPVVGAKAAASAASANAAKKGTNGTKGVKGVKGAAEEAKGAEKSAKRAEKGAKASKATKKAASVPPADADADAADVVLAGLRDLGEQLVALDPAVRADAPDAVHRQRTTVRRLRNVLAGHKHLFAPSALQEVRASLARFGGILGEVRDLEVRAEWAEAALDAVRDDRGVDDPAARDRLVAATRAEHDAAHERLLEWMSNAPYFRLLDAVEGLTPSGGAPDSARRESKAVLLRAARKAERLSVSRSRAAAVFGSDPVVTARAEAAVHESRKSARRLRHLAEFATGAPDAPLGVAAGLLGDAAERLQDALGEHRDARLFGEYVLLIAPRAEAAGESSFVYGVLYQRSLERSRAALATAARARKALRAAS
ncbi:CYTH and CHAD domain-containing protein [Herbiconiux sp.]|uniref:CYTH and CHAD domain-containing protein n=1 Tax=Herbiconiux sp. TaxID=1871186 RepID=UPI0025C6F2EB|nr:CYTH and CHAD domain-containing protein [Herbiconiux sp.]